MRGVYYDLVAMFPVAAEDDFCLRREAGHDVDPTFGGGGVWKSGEDYFAGIKSRVAFQTVDVLPVFDGECDKLGLDCCVPLWNVGGEAVTGVVECAGNGAWFYSDGVLAEAVVAVAGHQGSVGDDFDCLHFFFFLANAFLTW